MEYKTLAELLERDDRYDVNKITYFTHTDDEDLIIPDLNLIDKYRRFIAPYVVQYTMTKRERDFYRCRPYQLAYDVYDTPDLGLMIMILNDKECPSKFILRKRISLIPPNRIGELYETITTRSSEKLEDNWAEQLKDMER